MAEINPIEPPEQIKDVPFKKTEPKINPAEFKKTYKVQSVEKNGEEEKKQKKHRQESAADTEAAAAAGLLGPLAHVPQSKIEPSPYSVQTPSATSSTPKVGQASGHSTLTGRSYSPTGSTEATMSTTPDMQTSPSYQVPISTPISSTSTPQEPPPPDVETLITPAENTSIEYADNLQFEGQDYFQATPTANNYSQTPVSYEENTEQTDQSQTTTQTPSTTTTTNTTEQKTTNTKSSSTGEDLKPGANKIHIPFSIKKEQRDDLAGVSDISNEKDTPIQQTPEDAIDIAPNNTPIIAPASLKKEDPLKPTDKTSLITESTQGTIDTEPNNTPIIAPASLKKEVPLKPTDKTSLITESNQGAIDTEPNTTPAIPTGLLNPQKQEGLEGVTQTITEPNTTPAIPTGLLKPQKQEGLEGVTKTTSEINQGSVNTKDSQLIGSNINVALPPLPVSKPNVNLDTFTGSGEDVQGIAAPSLESSQDKGQDDSNHSDDADLAQAMQSNTPTPFSINLAVQAPAPAYTTLSPAILEMFDKMVGTISVLQETKGERKTTVTLTSPNFSSSVFYGSEIVIEEDLRLAPGQYNIRLIGSPEAVNLFQANQINLMAAFQSGNYNFTVQRFETAIQSIDNPVFKRKESGGDQGSQDSRQDQQQGQQGQQGQK
ncbi:MAG: hypothetical protein WCG14_03110 [Chlamydiia bacterium]